MYSSYLSFDGRTGDKPSVNHPVNLNLTKIEVNAGRSSQATLNCKDVLLKQLHITNIG
jgi:hypothetical protein